MTNQITLNQACDLIERLNNAGYNSYFKNIKGKINIVTEYIQVIIEK